MINFLKKHIWESICFCLDKSKNIKELLLGIAAIIAVCSIPEYKLSVEYKNKVDNKIQKQKEVVDRSLEMLKQYANLMEYSTQGREEHFNSESKAENATPSLKREQSRFIDEINKLQMDLKDN